MIRYCIEKLYHFSCGECGAWFSIGDWAAKHNRCRQLTCPNCGKRQPVEKKPVDDEAANVKHEEIMNILDAPSGYIAVQGKGTAYDCGRCAFTADTPECDSLACCAEERADGAHVYFVVAGARPNAKHQRPNDAP